MLLSVSLCGIIAAVIASELQHRKLMQDEIAQMAVAFLVCDYLDANHRHWPPDWDALKPYYDSRFPNEKEYTFERLQDRILLDFSIDGPGLLGVCVNPKRAAAFEPIRSKLGNYEFREENPNWIILDHVGRMISH